MQWRHAAPPAWLQIFLPARPAVLKADVIRFHTHGFPCKRNQIYPTAHCSRNPPAVLKADLIGFHTYDYARHFVSACTRILGLEGTPSGVSHCCEVLHGCQKDAGAELNRRHPHPGPRGHALRWVACLLQETWLIGLGC